MKALFYLAPLFLAACVATETGNPPIIDDEVLEHQLDLFHTNPHIPTHTTAPAGTVVPAEGDIEVYALGMDKVVKAPIQVDGSFDLRFDIIDIARLEVVSKEGRSQPIDLKVEGAKLVSFLGLTCLDIDKQVAVLGHNTSLSITNKCDRKITLSLKQNADVGFTFSPTVSLDAETSTEIAVDGTTATHTGVLVLRENNVIVAMVTLY